MVITKLWLLVGSYYPTISIKMRSSFYLSIVVVRLFCIVMKDSCFCFRYIVISECSVTKPSVSRNVNKHHFSIVLYI